MTQKARIAVRDNRQWQAVDLVNFTEEQKSNLDSVISLLTWHKMSHLGEAINNHKDGVITTLCAREAKHEIHAYISPWLSGNR